MFDIGFPEFFLAAVIALLVLGPERLPAALRTLGLWVGRLRRSYYNVKTEIEREIGMDEVRRQLHNEQVMADVRRAEREVQGLGEDIGSQLLDESPSSGAVQASAEVPHGIEPAAAGVAGTESGGQEANQAQSSGATDTSPDASPDTSLGTSPETSGTSSDTSARPG